MLKLITNKYCENWFIIFLLNYSFFKSCFIFKTRLILLYYVNFQDFKLIPI